METIIKLTLIALLLTIGCTPNQKNVDSQYWTGKPYEDMFNAISKHYELKYDTIGTYYHLYNKNTHTELHNNMEDLTILKKTIMEFLPFEPKYSKDDTYYYEHLEWQASRYDIDLMYKDNISIWVDLK